MRKNQKQRKPLETILVAEETTLPLPGAIRLTDIGTTQGGFGKYEVERIAGHLVEFFQERGTWRPFKMKALVEFYETKGWDPNKMFFGLTGAWFDDAMMLGGWKRSEIYLVFDPTGRCFVTEKFIEHCMSHLKKRN